ncbi:nuclear transport factor 2 family protein [Rufibacter hautae]|nr:nuclear transport factor 2 family protein [Rufibacter hautae]
MDNRNIEQRLAAIEDRMAIKYVVDEFSNLADTKEIDKQVLLFTADGVVVSVSNGQSAAPLKGREQLKQAFSGFLSNFHTVYHQNGQQTIDLQGNKAQATSYCRVILVGKQDGKEVKTTLYTIYKDSFVKENGKWLIKHRTSNFVHREVAEVPVN